MTNKQQLQQELLEKVKEGVKPSDLKKKPQKPSQVLKSPSPIVQNSSDEGYSSEEEKIPTPPITPNKKIKELQKEVNYWSNTASNHLKNLQLAQAKISSLETDLSVVKSFNKDLQEQIKNLKTQKTPPKESELLKEKNHQIEIIAIENEKNVNRVKELEQKNQDLTKTITNLQNQAKTTTEPQPTQTKTFHCSECNQAKPQDQLSRVFGKFSFCLECSKQARQEAIKEKQAKPQPQDFTCHLCNKPKTEIPVKMKLDSTLQEYLICLECKPLAKEFNEADLITDELWEKYPYSSASEILEKEFGIKPKA